MKRSSSGNQKLKEFGLPLGVLLIICVLTALVLIPKVKEVLAMRKKVEAQKVEVGKLSTKLADLQTLSEPELYDSANLLLTALPAEKDFYFVLTSIRRIFNDSSVVLGTFDFSPGEVSTQSSAKKTKGPQVMKMKLSFETTRENLNVLMDKMENVLPILEIEAIKFDRVSLATESASSAISSGQLTLRSFSLPLPKLLGNIDSPLPKISASDQKLIEELKSYSLVIPETLNPESQIVGKDNPFPF